MKIKIVACLFCIKQSLWFQKFKLRIHLFNITVNVIWELLQRPPKIGNDYPPPSKKMFHYFFLSKINLELVQQATSRKNTNVKNR